MKKFLSTLSVSAIMVVLFSILSGCEETQGSGSFSLKVSEVGPEFVQIAVTAPAALEMAYILDTQEKLMNNPHDIFNRGVNVVIKPNDQLRISTGLKENTQYYIYAVAKLDAYNFSPIITLPFKTTEYDFEATRTDFLKVVEQFYDGYKMRITFPKETKERENAIRYNQCCIMMYNYMASSDDYAALLYNGGKHIIDDTTLIYSEEENWFQTDIDSDNSGELDWDTQYNPVSPGEPVVFVAGEFSWMEDTPEYEDKYFGFPSGWVPGYYMPLLSHDYFEDMNDKEESEEEEENGVEQSSVGVITDYEVTGPMDEYWTGAFQRKHFRVKQPEPLDGEVDVQLVESSPINLTLEFYPDDNVVQYAVGVFDDGMYNQILELCNGKEEYLQWAITSYFAAYTFGTRVAQGAVQMKLTSFYYQEAIKADCDYHVLVTAMGDNMATTQNYQKYTFHTEQKKHWDPKEEEAIPAVIEVTPLPEKSGPFKATFNIKCTTAPENPAVRACYAVNYLRDWHLALNDKSTYWSLTSGNFGTESMASAMEFYGDDLAAINSPEGLDITIESVDGETTRLAVACYNEDYTPNNFNPNTAAGESIDNIEVWCPAVADYTTPYLSDVETTPWVDEDLYIDLVGKWTAKALHTNYDGTKEFYHTSDITIAADLYDYPKELTQEIYDIYAKTGKNGKDKDEVDAMWTEFHLLAEEVTQKRLVDHNRLVGIGWLDSDQYQLLRGRTPYDLFIATDYVAVDVSSLYNAYGPKWYIETEVDNETGEVKYFIPVDSELLPPASNWKGTFFLGVGRHVETDEGEQFTMITRGEGWDIKLPVTVSDDRNTITIHPLMYGDEGNKVAYYPNMIGIANGSTVLENPIISEIVLTRNLTGESAAAQNTVARRSSASYAKVSGDLPTDYYKPRTELKGKKPLPVIEGEIVSVEQFRERADRFIEKKYKINNN